MTAYLLEAVLNAVFGTIVAVVIELIRGWKSKENPGIIFLVFGIGSVIGGFIVKLIVCLRG